MKRTGTLNLEINKKNGKSAPGRVYSQGALKVMRPQYLDDSGQVTYYILNLGGGYLEGDHYTLAISLNEAADLYLTTQSATKIYCTHKDKTVQESTITLAEYSNLEYVPDAVIAYENAWYEQFQSIFMVPSSSLFTSEIITPGWSQTANGFTYKELLLSTKIYMNSQLKVLDTLSFCPKETDLKALGILDGYTHFGAILGINQKITECFIENLREYLMEKFKDIYFGISILEIPGFSLRLLGNSTGELEQIIYACQNYYRQHCLQKAPIALRKY